MSPLTLIDMQPLNSLSPSAADSTLFADRIHRINDHYRYARTFRINSYKEHLEKVGPGVLPELLTWLSPQAADPNADQLFIGTQLIARENWRFDAVEETLDWHQGEGEARRSGTLQLFPNSFYGIGHLFIGQHYFSLEINLLPVTYRINVSADAGAWVYGCEEGVCLGWDKNDDEWKQAHWENNRLQFSYGIQENLDRDEQRYQDLTKFTDTVTGNSWQPSEDSFSLSVTHPLRMNFHLCKGEPFQAAAALPADGSIFPCRMLIEFDPHASTFCGAILTGCNSLEGRVYAVTGAAANHAIAGNYTLRLDEIYLKFAVFGQKLYIGGQLVESSWVSGDMLSWNGLTAAEIAESGLPEYAWLCFSKNGDSFDDGERSFEGKRVVGDEASISIFV